MCLHTKNIKLKTAEEDLVCYKVVIRYEEKKYLSFYRGYIYELNKTYYETLLKLFPECKDKVFCIDKGFHSYVNFCDANDEYVYQKKMYDIALVKCIIPKGSQYLTGTDDLACECYCSNQIKILGEV